jgi:hypothetical protein
MIKKGVKETKIKMRGTGGKNERNKLWINC